MVNKLLWWIYKKRYNWTIMYISSKLLWHKFKRLYFDFSNNDLDNIFFCPLFIFKNIQINKIIILAIFTPVFILYPVAEIEVLARKEIFIFCIFIFYLFFAKNTYRLYYKLFFLPLAVLIWEPVCFFFYSFLLLI